MKNAIKTWQVMVLSWIARRIVVQSFEHKTNIITYFRVLNEVARDEFTEDNRSTLDGFLSECFELSLKKV